VKTTIEIDDGLYRRLKAEAALRGRKVKDLVAEGVRQVLNTFPDASLPPTPSASTARPAWFGSLHRYAKHARGHHTLSTMRASVARGRRRA